MPFPFRISRSLLVPLIVACAVFMENLDSTVIATALPEIARSLGADPLHLSLAITTYLLSLAVFIPVSGWVADRHGAKRVFRIAIVVFTLGSILCGLSQSMLQLVCARALQGLGGAMMVPVGRLLLLRKTPKHELVAAMSWLSIPGLLGPMLGPPVGGFIVTYASWRWIFFINVPIGLLGFWLVTRYIEETPREAGRALDLRGWLLLGPGLALLVLGFENLGKHIIAVPLVWALLLTGVALLVAYVLRARGRPGSVLDLTLLRIASFRATVSGGTLFRIGIGANALLLPLMLQLGYGMSAAASGSITFVAALGALLMKVAAPVLVARFGFRPLLAGNAVLSAVLLVGTALIDARAWPVALVVWLFVGGFFRSLQFTCMNTLAYSEIPPASMSQATSFSSTAQQLGITMGVGIAAQLLNAGLALRQGPALALVDFQWGYVAIALLTALSAWSFLRLPADAGDNLRGPRGNEKAPGG